MVLLPAGQRTASAAAAAAGKKYHWVKRGETLYLIAQKYGTTVERIMELNPQLKNPNRLSVGQAVRVK